MSRGRWGVRRDQRPVHACFLPLSTSGAGQVRSAVAAGISSQLSRSPQAASGHQPLRASSPSPPGPSSSPFNHPQLRLSFPSSEGWNLLPAFSTSSVSPLCQLTCPIPDSQFCMLNSLLHWQMRLLSPDYTLADTPPTREDSDLLCSPRLLQTRNFLWECYPQPQTCIAIPLTLTYAPQNIFLSNFGDFLTSLSLLVKHNLTLVRIPRDTGCCL